MNALVTIHERDPLPTPQAIREMTDQDALVALETDLEERRQRVEVDLEFATERGLDWERRARGFLTAVRSTLTHVRKRLHVLRTMNKPSPDQMVQYRAQKEGTKATRQLAAEQQSANALERKRQAQVALEIQAAALARKTVERLSYLHHFHAAALAQLSPQDMSRLANAASESMTRAAAEVLGVESTGAGA